MLIYANEACADWVGVELAALIASKCVYASQPAGSPVENRIQGLCPCPEAMADSAQDPSNLRPVFVSVNDANNQQHWRQATLHPFFDSDENHLGVVVICDLVDCSEPPPPNPVSCSIQPEHLHSALAQIRTITDRIQGLDSLVGTSPFSNRLRRQVQTAINSDSDLLIVGPRGSGKEHIARTIHSSRKRNNDSELLPIHCSIADQQLIQHNIKEIVASRPQPGLQSDANEQDWLLLLDVDLLGEAAQIEIMGFFQLPNFPLRTIATASKPLIQLAEQGQYSLDLAYHLSVLTIPLVPLADRQIDIPFLAQALLECNNFRRDQQLSGFTKSAMQYLVEYHWPENIDQLNRTIQAAAGNSESGKITDKDLPDEFHQALKALRVGEINETEIQLDRYLGQIEKELIRRALRQAKNNKTKAAKLLGISRPKLLRRIQHLELEAPGGESPGTSEDGEQLDASAFKELD